MKDEGVLSDEGNRVEQVTFPLRWIDIQEQEVSTGEPHERLPEEEGT